MSAPNTPVVGPSPPLPKRATTLAGHKLTESGPAKTRHVPLSLSEAKVLKDRFVEESQEPVLKTVPALEHFKDSVITVSTFAGGFTLSTIVGLANDFPRHRDIAELLAVAFLLFSLALFFAIQAGMADRAEGMSTAMRLCTGTWVSVKLIQLDRLALTNALLIISGWLVLGGFVLFGVVILKLLDSSTGVALIVLVGIVTVVFSLAAIVGFVIRVTQAKEEMRDP